MSSRDTKIKRTLLESGIGFLVAIYVMSSRDTKIKRTLLESGLGLLAKEYEKNPSYGHTRVHDNMVSRALRALGTKTIPNVSFISKYFPHPVSVFLRNYFFLQRPPEKSYSQKNASNSPRRL